MKVDDRPDTVLKLRVPDSGRTWSVMYDEINFIPPHEVEKGDVFIVHHKQYDGVMFMQAVAPKENGWVLDDVGPQGSYPS